MRTKIFKAIYEVYTLRKEFCSALNNADYTDLHISKSHLTTEHFRKEPKF